MNKNRLFNKFLLLALLTVNVLLESVSQLRYSAQVNSSSLNTTARNYQMTSQQNNVYIVFRRGIGTSSADRQIKIAVSSNNGVSFSEQDITIPDNSSTSRPIIASTASSIIVLYSYHDAAGNYKVCIARSINNGSTFTLSTIDNSLLAEVVYDNSYVPEEGSFISDGSSEYFIGNNDYLFLSIDNGISFTQIQSPRNNDLYIRLSCTSTYLWFVSYGSDSIFVFRSSNGGLSFDLITKFFGDIPIGQEFGCKAKDNLLHLAWVEEEIGTYFLRYRKIIGTTVGQIQIVDTSSFPQYYHNTTIHLDATVGRVFISVRGYTTSYFPSLVVFQSLDDGNNYSRGVNIAVECYAQWDFSSFRSRDDTTLYMISNNSGVPTNKLFFSNVKWVDFPLVRFANDTLLSISYSIGLPFVNYTPTPFSRLQFSLSSNFSSIVYDTLCESWPHFVTVVMYGRFNASRYYYRMRGEDGSYQTSWSPIKSFRWGTSDVSDLNNSILPNYFGLSQNYPNPFNPTTKFRFQVPQNVLCTITVFDLQGHMIETLIDEQKQPGYYEVEFDGSKLASGLYFYKMEAGNFTSIRKLIILK